MNPSTVTVLGDINGEVWGTVPGLRFREMTGDVLHYADLNIGVRGTAAGFALAALGLFDSVHIIGRVGTDILGEMVERELKARGVICHFGRDPVRPTGLAVALRDDDDTADRGFRVMVVEADGANHALDARDIAQCRVLLESTDLLVTDGYCVMREPRRSACLDAMAISRAAGAVVAFDVVPHDCYSRFSLDDIRIIANDAHVVIAEVRTVSGLLGLPDFGRLYTLDDALRALDQLRCQLGDRAYFLRFGLGNLDDSLCALPGQAPVRLNTGYSEAADPAGYGDRVTVAELTRHFAQLKDWSATK